MTRSPGLLSVRQLDRLRRVGMLLASACMGLLGWELISLYVAGPFLIPTPQAVARGLFMGRIRLLHDLFEPIMEFMRFLSPTAMIPIVVIWFGIGEMAKYT